MLAGNTPHMLQLVGKIYNPIELFGILSLGVFRVINILFAVLVISACYQKVGILVFTYFYIDTIIIF